MQKKPHILLAGTLLLLFAVLAILFGAYDLQISQFLYHRENAIGIFMERYAILVEPALISFAGIILCAAPWYSHTVSRSVSQIVCGCFVICGSFGYLIYEYADQGYLVLLTVFIIQAVCDWIVFFIAGRVSWKNLQRLSHIAVITAVFIIVTLTAVFLLKTVWGRIRFRELTDMALFTSWFLPQGVNGNHSFPSGHTSNAATLWVVTLFAPYLHRRWQKLLCYMIPAAWILLMAVCRVIAGAHYASDTLFAIGITIAIFYLVRKLLTRR